MLVNVRQGLLIYFIGPFYVRVVFNQQNSSGMWCEVNGKATSYSWNIFLQTSMPLGVTSFRVIFVALY